MQTFLGLLSKTPQMQSSWMKRQPSSKWCSSPPFPQQRRRRQLPVSSVRPCGPWASPAAAPPVLRSSLPFWCEQKRYLRACLLFCLWCYRFVHILWIYPSVTHEEFRLKHKKTKRIQPSRTRAKAMSSFSRAGPKKPRCLVSVHEKDLVQIRVNWKPCV